MSPVPQALVVVNSAFALDGGSRVLMLRDAHGVDHILDLPQHVIASNFKAGRPPGALILDGVVIPVRSPEEQQLLSALRSASYESRPTPKRRGDTRVAPPERRVIIGEDIKREFSAIDEGPEAALRHAVAAILAFVESDAYLAVARVHGRVP